MRIIGKTISGVVVKEASDDSEPLYQIFLEFTDGTHSEFYSHGKLSVAPAVCAGCRSRSRS